MRRNQGDESEETETAVYGSSEHRRSTGLDGGERTEPVDSGHDEDVHFDYHAFEQTIDQFRPPTPEPGLPRPSADLVQKRKTIDEQSIPKDDAVHEVRQLGKYQVVTIRGQINEKFPGRSIGGALHGPVVFDLTEVDRVTSFGVRAWLEMLEVSRPPAAVFVRASPAIVNQITMMRNFCGIARIQSLVAPYACVRCGSGFGVPLDVIEDRAILRSRNPPKVMCPECRGPAEMDEDPWVYFDIDDHLLDSVEPELQKVLAQLGDGPRRPPVEKSISGDVTRVRINGAVSANTRLQRAFTGLEGKVVLDLRTVTELDPGGLEHLLQCLVRLPDDVLRLSIEGASLPLVRAVIDHKPPRVQINSVLTTVRSLSRPLRRRVCVDLKLHRVAIKDQVVPDFDLPWRGDPMQLDGQELLADALALSPTTSSPTSTGVMPRPGGTGGTGGTGSGSITSPSLSAVSVSVSSVGAVSPVVPRPMPVPSARRRANPWFWVAVSAALLLGAISLVGGAFVFAMVEGRPGVGVPAAGWTTGGDLPPSWSELEIAEADGAILVVGHGQAQLPDDALSAARDQALDTLLVVLARELRLPFPDEALPSDGPEREAALQQWRQASASLVLTRVRDAARRTSDGYEVVAQYSVPRADLDALSQRFTRQISFRGLTLASRAPWAPVGVRLVRRESYLRNVEPGDVLRTVGGAPVSDLDQLGDLAEQAYHALPEGASLEFVFDRNGQAVSTSIFKPRTHTEPAPAQVNRPVLFRKPDGG